MGKVTRYGNLVGKVFGRLTVIDSYRDEKNKTVWKCRCECGNLTTKTYTYDLVHGKTKSCGCYGKEKFNAYAKRKKIDITGIRFGKLVVLGEHSNDGRNIRWKCKCDCGEHSVVLGSQLRGGKTRSCGCLIGGRLELLGNTYGELTVTGYAGIHKQGMSLWECKCTCGATHIVRGSNLVEGRTRSCGCKRNQFNSESTSLRNLKHGQAYSNNKTPEYVVWENMKKRCSPLYYQSKDYYDRGISICDRWVDKEHGFENFYEDMGARPDRYMSIDRVDNDKGYYKENCRWATRTQQNNNRRNVVLVLGKTIQAWSVITEINRTSIADRLRQGWSPISAVITPSGEPPIPLS